MKISAQTAQQIDDLYQHYLTLHPTEQVVLQILSVIYKPIAINKFNEVLKLSFDAQIYPADEQLKNLPIEQRNKLIEQNFIVQDQSGIQINVLLANRLTLDCMIGRRFVSIVNIAEKVAPVVFTYQWQSNEIDEQRLIRDYYFLNEMDNLEQALQFDKNPQIIDTRRNKILITLLFLPFNLDTFLTLSDVVQYQSFASLFKINQKLGNSHAYSLSLLEQVVEHNPNNINLRHLLAEQYLFQLQFDNFNRILLQNDSSCYALQLNASYLFLTGEYEQSRQLFKQAITAKNKYTRRKKQYLNGVFGVFYKLCLTVLGSQHNASLYDVALQQIEFETSDKKAEELNSYVSHAMENGLLSLSQGEQYRLATDKFKFITRFNLFYFHSIQLFNLVYEVWCNGPIVTQVKVNKTKQNNPMQTQLNQSIAFFEQLDMPLFCVIAQQLAAWPKQIEQVSSSPNNNDNKLVHFPTLVSRKAEWDIALEKLLALNKTTATKPATKATTDKPTRLIWEMELLRNQVSFKPREQKRTSKGWSKGRPVALKRLYHDYTAFNYLTEQDTQLCKNITAYQSWGYYSTTEYALDGIEALRAAQGANNLYLAENLTAPIELSQKEPELLVSQQGEQLLLSIADLPDNIDNNDDNHQPFSIKEIAPEHYCFTVFSKSHIAVANIIGEAGLMIPLHAKAKVLESVSAIAPLLNIQSDIDELDTGLETVVNDEHLVINIQPLNQGLEFSCMIMPFGEQGPAFKPAVGNANLTTELNGKRIATQRNLINEQQLLDKLDQHCPQFLNMSDNTLAVDDIQDSLETLEQLENVVNQTPLPFALKLRWPKGKKVNLTKRLESQHLQLAVNKKNEWFDLTGELKINDETVIELRRLLELVTTSNGRFVELNAGQILALSQDLRQKLDQLNQATDDGKFHHLASLQVAEATTGMRMKTIHAWEEQTKKMHESNTINPTVPSTLQAELRDYQHAGFDWASRLAYWGAGACLADDMGLGKTLQALTILLSRAKNGPSLVIAPTSVCFNWLQEALKFAPTLNMKLFADSSNSEDRENLLTDLTAFDCVVISYGLLQRESELLAKVHWHTIVADEAQALKNPLAKRTLAAYALKGDFKLITTGTPIENNLTELWSLFRFINPGLLGNLKRFGERYALPIENVKEDKLAARKASLGLKTLIQPFMLRRMKNQVLTELPSRTEINISIELSKKEQAFYEALRLNALDNISKANETANAGEQRIKMLAELVKLRQACCNPKLVMAESDLPSAKLAALDELLDELILNKHKALIFSQFVGHLQLIKQHLELRDIRYQYLDGSTPQKDRQKRVNAFQSGEGDVFLISLKAGGSGLNLTAADYVIHMDPWWNPAVEEQASDRAHRMGQLRPVTVYRLITKNTIEEKIVALHQHKRDLADKLLEGNEQASKLSVDDMLNMLKETF